MNEFRYDILVNDEIFAENCTLQIALMIVETFAVKFYAEPSLKVSIQRKAKPVEAPVVEEESVEEK